MKRTKILFVTLVVALLLGGFALTAGATGDEDAVRVDVVKEIQAEDELVVYKVRVPEFAGLEDLDFQGQLNETILDRALEDVETVESQAEEFAVLAEIFIDFDVKSSGDILSLVVNNYMYTGGANGITRIDTYNIDTKNCVILGIADLFKPASEYEEVINEGIRAQIKDKVENEEATFFTGEDGFVTISDEQDFYIEDNDLVILFQKYDIAPGVMGTPEFKISMASLDGILKDQKLPRYLSVTGIVKEVVDGDKSTTLRIEDENGGPANLTITGDTYIVDNAEIVEGSEVIGFYDATRPMILIYPPVYNIEVVALVDETRNIKADIFDENLVSSDQMLKLNISDETEITLPDGSVYTGELANEKLVVIYGPSTKSIPAQTTPYKVVILFEKPDPLYDSEDISKMDIIVNNEKVEAPRAYMNEEDVVMVPIRAICEALGFEVSWDDETRSVAVGEEISLTADKDSYYKTKDVEISLGIASEIKNDRLFVPLKFFKEVVDMNNAYVFEAQIVVDNFGEMH